LLAVLAVMGMFSPGLVPRGGGAGRAGGFVMRRQPARMECMPDRDGEGEKAMPLQLGLEVVWSLELSRRLRDCDLPGRGGAHHDDGFAVGYRLACLAPQCWVVREPPERTCVSRRSRTR
jgi:hypothetical protein